MQTALDIISVIMLFFGMFFFLAGLIALWRFPDTLSRLHAITKADNLGLGFIVLAVALQTGWSILLLKLVAIYLLALYGAAINGYLIARSAHGHRDKKRKHR